MSEVTQILNAILQGDSKAEDALLAIVYDELHRIASRKLAGESPGQTLQTTALVHEAYLRLLPGGAPDHSTATTDTRSTGMLETAKQPSWQSRGGHSETQHRAEPWYET